MSEKWFHGILSLRVQCVHETGDPDEPVELVDMEIKSCDPDIPSYSAICLKCGREVIIDFNP